MRETQEIEPLLSIDDVAAILGVPKATLYGWRHRRKGPKGLRVGRVLRYAPADVRAWIAEQRDARSGDAA